MTLSKSVIRKELLVMLRTRRAFVILFLTIAGAFISVVVAWPQAELVHRAGQISHQVLASFALVQLVMVSLFAPAFAAGSISGEREANTYDMLFGTYLRPHALLLGKLVSSCGYLALLMVAGLPALTMTFLLGGVTATDIGVLYGITFALLVTYTLVAMTWSAFLRTTRASFIASYVTVLLHSLLSEVSGLRAVVWHDYRMALWRDRFLAATSTWGWLTESRLLLIHFGGLAVLSVALFLILLRVLGKPREGRRLVPRPALYDEAELTRRRRSYPYFLIDPMTPTRPISDTQNPVFAKEMRAGLLRRSTSRIWQFGLCLPVVCFLAAFVRLLVGERASLCVLAVVLLLTLPAIAASMFTREREAGCLDSLRSTLLTPWEVVMGKLKAALVATFPVWGTVCLAQLISPLLAWGYCKPGTIVPGALLLACSACVSCCVGLRASVAARTSAVSAVIAYAMGVLLISTAQVGMEVTQLLYRHCYPRAFYRSGGLTGLLVSHHWWNFWYGYPLRTTLLTASAAFTISLALLASTALSYSKSMARDR